MSINACGCNLLLCWRCVAISVTTVEDGEWLVGDVAKVAGGFPHLMGERNRREWIFVVLPWYGTIIVPPIPSVWGRPYESVFGIKTKLPWVSVAGCGVGHPNLSVNDWRCIKWFAGFLLMVFSPAPSRNGVGLDQCLALDILTGHVIPWTGLTEKKGKHVLQATCSIYALHTVKVFKIYILYTCFFVSCFMPYTLANGSVLNSPDTI